MKGQVITHPELFSDLVHRALGMPPRSNEHGVYLEPDESLQCTETRTNGRRYGYATDKHEAVIAEIELLDLRNGRWIGSFSYSFSQGGASSPLTTSFGWNRDRSIAEGVDRATCLQDCKQKLAANIASYVAHQGATKQTRRAAAWLEKLA
jgi:hypothetical protein